MLRLAFFISLAVFCLAGARGTEIAGWTPAASNGLSLVRGPDAAWTTDGKFAVVAPVADYYRRACFLIRVDKPVPSPAWLQVKYLDRGYGLISLQYGPDGGTRIRAQHQWGIARLNTGSVRSAVFRLQNTEFLHRLDRR